MKTGIKLMFQRASVVVMMAMLLVLSCKKDKNEVVLDQGYSYFPLIAGRELIYQVDSIGWLGFTYDPTLHTITIDSVSYQIKEVVEDFFYDMQGRQTARVVRYRRQTPADPWVVYKVFTANLNPASAERFEDNVKYIKLVFPVKEGEKWTGQEYNPMLNDTLYDPWEYEYTSVNEPMQLNALSFDSVLTVLQKDESTLVGNQYYQEQYAAGTGMIYKEYMHQDLDIGGYIKNGFIYKESLISN
jgi:hypothetical protein